MQMCVRFEQRCVYWPQDVRLFICSTSICSLSSLVFCLGCKLLGHQRFARCDLQDGCKHDQRQNPRGDQKDVQYQKWFHRGRGSPGKNKSSFYPVSRDVMRSRSPEYVCVCVLQVRKENQWCEEKWRSWHTLTLWIGPKKRKKVIKKIALRCSYLTQINSQIPCVLLACVV